MCNGVIPCQHTISGSGHDRQTSVQTGKAMKVPLPKATCNLGSAVYCTVACAGLCSHNTHQSCMQGNLLWCHLSCASLPICRVGSCDNSLATRYRFDVMQLITVNVKYCHLQNNSNIKVTPCEHLPCHMLPPGRSHVTAAC